MKLTCIKAVESNIEDAGVKKRKRMERGRLICSTETSMKIMKNEAFLEESDFTFVIDFTKKDTNDGQGYCQKKG